MGLFNTKTTEEIQEENRLLRERKIAGDIERSEKEEDKRLRRQVQKENIALKNPKKVRLVKKVGGGAKDLGKGLLWGINKAGTQYAKAHASRQPQERSSKKKVKRVRKVKKKSFGSQFGLEPRFSFG